MLPGRDVPTETNRGAGDPQLWRDPITNRVWYTTIGGSDVVEAAICQVDLSYSDDDGKTWVNNPDPALWGCPAFDFPRPFTGPPRTSTIPPGERYPDVLYLCKSSHTVPDRQCWKSLDSGKSFTEIPPSGQYQPWTADINGVVYGVSNGQLHISGDEMATWLNMPVPAGFAGRVAVDRLGRLHQLDGRGRHHGARLTFRPAPAPRSRAARRACRRASRRARRRARPRTAAR